ncbi:MAG TPA: hypothetical protein VN026_06230, partial [Bacteroidia bacterium]|nr:hypothetical protein [Bacteroidia bacterium]
EGAKKAAEEKTIADKQKAAEEKAIADKANKEKIAAEKAEANKLAKEKAAADKEAKAKALAEKEAADREAKSNAAKNKPEPEKKKAEKEPENTGNKMPGDEGKVKKHEYETKNKDGEPVIGHGDSKYRKPQVLAPNKYKDALAKAEGFLKMKRWAEAKTAYEEVLKIKPDDAYATAKLAEVNKFLVK